MRPAEVGQDEKTVLVNDSPMIPNDFQWFPMIPNDSGLVLAPSTSDFRNPEI